MHKRVRYSELPNSLPDEQKDRLSTINPQTDPQTNTPTRAKIKTPGRTKTSQKLALFPEESIDQIDESEIYIKQNLLGPALVEAESFTREEREKLPRVTAYCTASAYKLDELMKNIQGRKIRNSTSPRRFEECVYTPFSFTVPVSPPITADLLGINDSEISTQVQEILPEVFFFDYGVVVIWGMNEREEKNLLRELIPFEQDRLAAKDIVTEEFHYHYAASYHPRIYNDVITLKNPANYMIKLTISHAVAQSVKMSFFEELIEETIETTKHIPKTMAETGKVFMTRTAITQKIGQLFIMRININLVSNILDTPEIFWSEPVYEGLYKTIRGYLEISNRVDLLNQRVSVISDLLDMLKDHLTSSHGEVLEWIIIVLIGVEILVGCMTIFIEALRYSAKTNH
ncbi:hypothetical protein G9A89_010190 [Geosiphon pyriformis]|nr:hypothetical protein G9A89_010190 [Geosiphon pyriformis]